jgi:aminoglycoside 6'-N-acetyltransferase I
MEIVDLAARGDKLLRQVAVLLLESFRNISPQSWPDMNAAMEEVKASLGPDRVSRVAIEPDGTVLGWIGAIRKYMGHTWEVHPLVVRPEQRGAGIGKALLADLENEVRIRGGLTLYVGADDENNQTSLAGVDLYPNVWEHIARIENRDRHVYEFYQKSGYVIVGLIPDANGPGKPDIFLAKRLA